MGDDPASSVPPTSHSSREMHTSGSNYLHTQTQNQTSVPQGLAMADAQPGYAPQAPTQPYGSTSNAFSSQFELASPNISNRLGSFNMAGMVAALPPHQHQHQHQYRSGPLTQGGQQRFNPANSPSPSMMGQMPQLQHYNPQAGMPPYYTIHQHPQMQQFYGGQLSSAQHSANMAHRQNINFYQGQMVMPQPQGHSNMPPSFYYQPGPYHAPTGGVGGGMVSGQYMPIDTSQTDPRAINQSPSADQNDISPYLQPPTSASAAESTKSGIVRGPPRKPRQSGHAIWIGNLPPQTDLMNLVHHVCKEAPGLESLFLISKSNCAFANFKDELTCGAAQQKLHDSKFQSVRLVSRLRKSTVEGAAGVTAPTGPSSASNAATIETPDGMTAFDPPTGESGMASPESAHAGTGKSLAASDDASSQSDKFFILKSLTVEDLELSVRTGMWATQSHNEESLNTAFKAAENVYLVFSANKSGEYFGYARMTSEINEDPAAAIEFAPKAQPATDINLPKAIPTEATEFSPKGRIIDDSARGTIFWEADREESESADEEESDASSRKSGQEPGAEAGRAWGKPFNLEWLSTSKLPFYRTRGLRNPWNSNREVKIARDGTELEPSTGRRLIGLFNTVHSPAPAIRPGGAMMGYPPMRPHY